jgi:hypothetical protein
LIEISIPASVEVIGEECFAFCTLLSSVTFESGSRLSRIENQAFGKTALIEIIIPPSVADCRSLSSVTFESRSRMPGIEERELTQRRCREMILPKLVEEISDIKD